MNRRHFLGSVAGGIALALSPVFFNQANLAQAKVLRTWSSGLGHPRIIRRVWLDDKLIFDGPPIHIDETEVLEIDYLTTRYTPAPQSEAVDQGPAFPFFGAPPRWVQGGVEL